MDATTANILRTINNDFYRSQAASFSVTRQAPWPGWERCLATVQDIWTVTGAAPAPALSVLDLACGNLRFEDYLSRALPAAELTCYAVDNCPDFLVAPDVPARDASRKLLINSRSLDVLDLLARGQSLNDHLTGVPLCDLSISFGFLHHVPGAACREQVLSNLLQQTRPGGYVVVSLWQFMKDPARREKALVTHAQALKDLAATGLTPSALDADDYLLGWKDLPGVYRYCHYFSEAEIDQLVASVAARATVIARFTADGRTGDLNTYLILRAQ